MNLVFTSAHVRLCRRYTLALLQVEACLDYVNPYNAEIQLIADQSIIKHASLSRVLGFYLLERNLLVSTHRYVY